MENSIRHEAEALDWQIERICRFVQYREAAKALENTSVLTDTWAALPTDIRQSVGEALVASAERTWW